MTALALIGAEILKLRRRLATVGWALFLTVGVEIIFFLVRELNNSPSGGVHGFTRGLDALGLFVGPLAAVMIGAQAGAGDEESGVFRDLVVTGRSRVALFAVRLPGAIAVCWVAVALGFGVLVAGTFLFAGEMPNPSASLVAESAVWVLVADGLVCVIAVGLASLLGSRPTITVLTGWQLIVSPILVRTSSLGEPRKALLDAALLQLKPGPAGGAPLIPMSLLLAIVVCAGWLCAWAVLGAWRANTRDA